MKKLLILALFLSAFLVVGCGRKNTPMPENNIQPVQENSSSTNSEITSDWKIVANKEYNFSLKYPSGFFDVNQEPKILIGDCNYSVFPSSCPEINDLVTKELVASGGDINAIKNNLAASNYWKNPTGEKLIKNNTSYCLYQTVDAAMGHTYNYYYYTTVKNQKCFVVYLATATTNCDFYLPLEKNNAEQQKNYDDCLAAKQKQPIIFNQIISTFKFVE